MCNRGMGMVQRSSGCYKRFMIKTGDALSRPTSVPPRHDHQHNHPALARRTRCCRRWGAFAVHGVCGAWITEVACSQMLVDQRWLTAPDPNSCEHQALVMLLRGMIGACVCMQRWGHIRLFLHACAVLCLLSACCTTQISVVSSFLKRLTENRNNCFSL